MDIDHEERRARLVRAALDGRADVAERLLADDPELARAGFDVALVLGDAGAVAVALDADPRAGLARCARARSQAALVRLPFRVPALISRRARPTSADR